MKKLLFVFIAFLCILFLIFQIYIMYNQNTQQIAVLTYHNIIPNNVQKTDNDSLFLDEFENQIQYLKNSGYTTISAEELYNWKNGNVELPDKTVLITFDDGYYSFKYLVQPILEKYDFKAICFLIGDLTGTTTPTYSPDSYGTIGKDEIENHIKNVEYGSHTYSMHSLTNNGEKAITTFSIDDLKNDTSLFNNNTFNAQYLSYPFYTYTKEYINVLKEYNYKLAFAGEEEMATRKVDNFKIPRISAVKSFEEFKEIFETNKYKNKYGNGLIRKICVTIERKLK